MANESNRSNSIDFIKGIAAILIVFLHCSNEDAFDSIIHLLGRMAVPIFFIITGYYLPSMIKTRHIRKHIIKVVKIAIGGLIFYFPLYCLESYLNGNLMQQLSQVIPWNNLWRYLLFAQYPFHVNADHLWYLIAILYILCFIYLYTKKCEIRKLYFLIPILFISGYLISSFDYEDTRRIYYQNYLFIGLPYVLLGSFINENVKNNLLDNKKIGLLIGLFGFLYIAEIGLYYFLGLPTHREHYLCIIPLVTLVLIWASQNQTFGHNSIITLIGRDYSIYIYVIHFYIVNKMWFIFHGSSIDSKLQMISSIILSLLVSYIYIWIKKRWRNSRQKID